ncbi:uncharacterized protein METZ01_LOCUS479759, partial [marine metagenome]
SGSNISWRNFLISPHGTTRYWQAVMMSITQSWKLILI